MPHIHTQKGQYDHTASALIFRTDFVEPKLLLHMHKKLHALAQPGGHIELDETPWQAVAHEIREEAGYDLDQLQLLQPPVRLKQVSFAKLHPVPVAHNSHAFDERSEHFHSDLAYGFVTDQPPRHPVGDGESTDLRWVTRAELAALPQAEIYDGIREIAAFAFDSCLPQWERIPATDVDL